MTNPKIVSAESAIPMKSKISILVEEGWRRVRNCSPSLPWSKIKEVLRVFNNQMKLDGHRESFRVMITQKILNKYNKRVSEDVAGTREYYRSRKNRELEKETDNKKVKTAWIEKRGFDVMMKVDHTPRSELAQNINKRISREVPEIKVLVQEQTGSKIQKKVVNSQDPWQEKYCGRNQCHACKSSTVGSVGKCWQQNANYEITCNKCIKNAVRSVYIGETKSVFTRFEKHVDLLRRKSDASVLHKHTRDDHPNEELTEDDYEFKPTKKNSSALERQAAESAFLQREIRAQQELSNEPAIKKYKQIKILNSRGEFHQPAGLIKVRSSNYFEDS